MLWVGLILGVIVVVVLVVALAAGPALKKRSDAAIYAARDLVGGSTIALEAKVVGLGTVPEEAGGLRGMGVLAASETGLAFVTWAPQKEWSIERSAITKLDTAAGDAGSVEKTTILVTYNGDEGETVAQFRLKEGLHEFLDAMGYDWGPEGRPEIETYDDEDV